MGCVFRFVLTKLENKGQKKENRTKERYEKGKEKKNKETIED